MTQLVKLDDRSKSVQQLFTANMPAMVKAIPRTVGDPNRLIRMAFNSIAYNPDLLQCSHASLIAGVMEAVKMGLTVGGPMQECWLIPFNVKGQKEATLIVGYQGYRNLVDRAKSVLDLHPRAVYQNDAFDVDFGSNARVIHKPYWMNGMNEPGPLVAVYAVAHLRGGGVQIEVMPKAEVDQHRSRSRAGGSGPWVTDYDSMALKTVIRKIIKYLPKQSEVMESISRAMQLDDRADRGESQYGDADLAGMQVFDEGPVAATKPKALEALKAAAGVVTKNEQPIAPEQARAEVVADVAPNVATTQPVQGFSPTMFKDSVLNIPKPGTLADTVKQAGEDARAAAERALFDDDKNLDLEIASQDGKRK